jgi:hypothetical protein
MGSDRFFPPAKISQVVPGTSYSAPVAVNADVV